jgi:hypothetical protein
MLSWSEVAAIYNYRENEQLKPETVKQIGLVAMRKLKERFEENGESLEDLVDL